MSDDRTFRTEEGAGPTTVAPDQTDGLAERIERERTERQAEAEERLRDAIKFWVDTMIGVPGEVGDAVLVAHREGWYYLYAPDDPADGHPIPAHRVLGLLDTAHDIAREHYRKDDR